MSIMNLIKSVFRPRSLKQKNLTKGESFDVDYIKANALVKERLDAKFPDNYHASIIENYDRTKDHGAYRKDAIDIISREISLALRQGASVQAASEKAAKSVGL